MRKFITSSPLTTLLIIVVISVSCLFIVNACRKTDEKNQSTHNTVDVRQRFFNEHSSMNPVVVAIAQSIKRQDEQRHFVPMLSNNAGFPVWNKAILFSGTLHNTAARLQSDSGEIVLIPFVKDDKNITNAILLVNLSSVSRDTVYQLLYSNRYEDFGFDFSDTTKLCARDIFHLFITFDNEIFGFTKFTVKDRRIITGNAKDTTDQTDVILTDGKGTTSENRMASITFCNTIEYCGLCGFRGESIEEDRCCNPTYQTVCTTIIYDDGGGGSGGGGGIGGGGGGGGGWENQNPCRAQPSSGSPCTTGGGIGGSGSTPPGPGGGWVPITDDGETPPYIINNLTKRCLKNALNKLTTAPNTTFFNHIYNIFDTASSLQLTFEEETNDTAYGVCSFIDSSSVGAIATITMDTTTLLQCSQEWIAYVFIHEVAHAAMFSHLIQWDTANSQHAAMISTYLTQMATCLKSAFPGLSDFDAYSICYDGFYNGIDGTTGEAAFMYLMLKEVKAKANDQMITAQQLIDRGKEYTETGTKGTRISCN